MQPKREDFATDEAYNVAKAAYDGTMAGKAGGINWRDVGRVTWNAAGALIGAAILGATAGAAASAVMKRGNDTSAANSATRGR